MRIRYAFVNSTILFFFLVYAISPLSYACAPFAVTGSHAAGQEDAGFRNFSIYFFEAVLKGFFSPEDDGAAPSDESILVIKKHALVRLSPEIRQKLVKSAATVGSAAVVCQSWSREPALAATGVYQSAEIPAYSGLSPPSLLCSSAAMVSEQKEDSIYGFS